MKILHIIDTLTRGGAERLLVMLLPELARQGHDVAVAVRSAPYDLQPELEAAGVPVFRLPKRHKWNLIAGARDIARAMPDVDILHAHLYFPAVNTAIARMVGLTQAKTIVTFHNLAYAGANREGLKLRFRKVLARILYSRGIQKKLAVSQAVADHYEAALSLDRVDVVYNPIDLSAIDAIPKVVRDAHDPLHIVLPGRLVSEKGHTDLLTALRDPRLQTRLMKVTFAGHGKLHESLRKASQTLPFALEITGNLDHRTFLGVLATADIVVMPSRFEGFGLTALEAMALRLPVVANRVGGLSEVVVDGETGFLVKRGEPTDLAQAIDKLAADRELCDRLGEAGRARSETHFALPRIVDRLQQIYNEVLDRGAVSTP